MRFGTYIVFLSAFMFGTFLSRAAIILAAKYGIMDQPNPIVPQHTAPTARLGGAAIAAASLCSLVLYKLLVPAAVLAQSDRLESLPPLVSGATLFLLVGLVDDLTELAPASKFALQALAAVGAGFMGLVYPWTGVRLIDFVSSCFWILVLVNAVNLIDVCDGLVGGLALIVSIFFACFGPGNHLLPGALAGACAGFLIFNPGFPI